MSRSKSSLPSRLFAGFLSAALIWPAASPLALAQSATQSAQASLSEAQIAALVAPIALYPDPLVAQVLMASTYPTQVSEAYTWSKANDQLKGEALNKALEQQSWDASVKSLVSFPPVLDMMGSQLSWTEQLGDTVLAQQNEVMDAIQSLRQKAQAADTLKSNEQQTVTVQGSGSNTTVVIQPTNPQVVYVPTYNPVVVYGAWPYPAYPPVAYYPPGYAVGTAIISFGIGMAVGSALWGGCNWGGRSITVNNTTFNNFNRNVTRNWETQSRDGVSDWRSSRAAPTGNRLNDTSVRHTATNEARVNAEREQLRQNLERSGMTGNAAGDRRAAVQDRAAGHQGQVRDQARDQTRDQARDQLRERPNTDRPAVDRTAANHQPANRPQVNRPAGDGFGGGNRAGGFGNVDRARFDSGSHFGGGGGGARAGGLRR
jgi:hypothetical protein